MSRRATSPRSTSGASPPSTPTTGGCGTGWGRSSASTMRCPGPTGSWRRPVPSVGPRSHHLLAGKGAVFGSKMGWERPNVFAPSGQEPRLDYTWGKPDWLAWSVAEQTATRERVAVFDETSFGKLLVVGRDAETVLQRLCTADVAVEPGRAVYTGMLNERAGYEADVTVTRLAADRYLLVTSAASPVRDAAWIERHLRVGEHVSVVDVSSAFAVIGVMGPASRELLGRLGSAALSDEAFPFSTSRRSPSATPRCGPPGSPTSASWVGSSTSRPSSQSACTRTCWAPGPTSGSSTRGTTQSTAFASTRATGPSAPTSLRTTRPLEAGLRFTCKLATPIDFVGRSALEAAIAAGPRRRLASFRVGDPAAMLWGGELVLHDGIPAGQVSSAAWSATCGAAVGLAYVWRRDRRARQGRRPGQRDLGGDGGRRGDADGRPARGVLRPDLGPGPGLSGFPICFLGIGLSEGGLSNAQAPAGTRCVQRPGGYNEGGRPRGGSWLPPSASAWPTTSTPRAAGSAGSDCSSGAQASGQINDRVGARHRRPGCLSIRCCGPIRQRIFLRRQRRAGPPADLRGSGARPFSPSTRGCFPQAAGLRPVLT